MTTATFMFVNLLKKHLIKNSIVFFVVFVYLTFNLKVFTFNVQGIKTSTTTIQEMCKDFDIIMIQEHKLYPGEHSYLSMLSNDSNGFGLSPMPVGKKLLSGRLYGGVGIMLHESSQNVPKWFNMMTREFQV